MNQPIYYILTIFVRVTISGFKSSLCDLTQLTLGVTAVRPPIPGLPTTDLNLNNVCSTVELQFRPEFCPCWPLSPRARVIFSVPLFGACVVFVAKAGLLLAALFLSIQSPFSFDWWIHLHLELLLMCKDFLLMPSYCFLLALCSPFLPTFVTAIFCGHVLCLPFLCASSLSFCCDYFEAYISHLINKMVHVQLSASWFWSSTKASLFYSLF